MMAHGYFRPAHTLTWMDCSAAGLFGPKAPKTASRAAHASPSSSETAFLVGFKTGSSSGSMRRPGKRGAGRRFYRSSPRKHALWSLVTEAKPENMVPRGSTRLRAPLDLLILARGSKARVKAGDASRKARVEATAARRRRRRGRRPAGAGRHGRRLSPAGGGGGGAGGGRWVRRGAEAGGDGRAEAGGRWACGGHRGPAGRRRAWRRAGAERPAASGSRAMRKEKTRREGKKNKKKRK
jgi:hypothetical protein